MNLKKNNYISKLIKIVIILLISIVFVFAFFYNLNPLEVTTNSTTKAHDPSCFYIEGTSVVNGKLPYRDIFDNKGPILFLLNALPQFLTDSLWGFSAMAILYIFFSLLIVGAISKSLGVKQAIIPQILYLFIYALFDFGGWQCEEMSNLFVLISFYVAIRFLKNRSESSKKTFIYAFWVSVMFWLSFMVRLNNAVPVGGLILGIMILLLKDKNFKELLNCIIAFFTGTVVAVLPFVMWFGFNHSIKDWLYATIFVNFGYNGAAEQKSTDILFFTDYGYKLLLFLIIGISGYMIFKLCKRNENPVSDSISFVSLISLAVSFISCLFVSNYFIHYTFVCFVPAFVLACFLFVTTNKENNKKESRKKIATTAIILFLSIYTVLSGFEPIAYGATRLKDHAVFALNGFKISEQSAVSDAKKIADFIPDEEKNSVFSIDVPTNWYTLAGVVPCKRLFVCQGLFVAINEDLRKEYNNYFIEEPPKWVLCYEKIEEAKPDYLDVDISNMYEFVSVNRFTNFQDVYLYKLKSAKSN